MLDEAPPIRRADWQRPDPARVALLAGVPTGHVVDALGGSGALHARIKPAVPEQAVFVGVALTCDNGPADNLALCVALASVRPGDVLVAATGGHLGCAVTGDLVLGMARNGGAVGFVTDGCVRDVAGIRGVGLPAFCAGVTPDSPARNGPGTVGVPVLVGGRAVASGDVLVADPDGVVVIPQSRLEEVLARLPVVRAAEAEMERRVAEGLRTPPFVSIP
jgi:4-hydroxy-4-methyl-2-oxoglutarate aldolase